MFSRSLAGASAVCGTRVVQGHYTSSIDTPEKLETSLAIPVWCWAVASTPLTLLGEHAHCSSTFFPWERKARGISPILP